MAWYLVRCRDNFTFYLYHKVVEGLECLFYHDTHAPFMT
jgi:hypothetical protein